MAYLFLVSALWAFSFGLIKRHLVGLDASAVAAVRLAFSLALFLPFLRFRGLKVRSACVLAALGFFQFGLMYVAYLRAFQDLESFQVALFTLFTPLWVTSVSDLLDRRFHPRFLAAAALAVLGAAIVTFRGWGETWPWVGFLFVQASNLCFAIGQVGYARWMERQAGLRDRDVFALLYVGGFLGAGMVASTTGASVPFQPTQRQWLVLAYLGLVASGLGFFWWNLGARRVSGGTLAVMNNLKVPLGVLVSLLVFGERTDLTRLVVGGAVMALALWMNGCATPGESAKGAEG